MSSPVTREQLMGLKTVFSHAFCPDGMSSSMIVAASLASVEVVPEFRFVVYESADQMAAPTDTGQLWVDITPPMKRWEDWKGCSPIVLDHHESAKAAALGLSGVYGGLDDSGASLAFRHVMRVLCPDRDDIEEWAKFAYLCMVRDTWKDGSPDWQEATAVANSLGFYTQKALMTAASAGRIDLHEMLRFGRVLMKKTADKVFRTIKGVAFRTVRGLKVGIFNNTDKIISETGHALLEDHGCDIAAGFFMTAENGIVEIVCSLRSKKGGVPVHKVAEHFGGGGHQPAAAFRLKGAEDLGFNQLVSRLQEGLEAALG